MATNPNSRCESDTREIDPRFAKDESTNAVLAANGWMFDLVDKARTSRPPVAQSGIAYQVWPLSVITR